MDFLDILYMHDKVEEYQKKRGVFPDYREMDRLETLYVMASPKSHRALAFELNKSESYIRNLRKLKAHIKVPKEKLGRLREKVE